MCRFDREKCDFPFFLCQSQFSLSNPNFLCQSFFSLSISHFSLSKIDSETRTHRFKLFQIIDFDKVTEYEDLRKKGWAGFADVYLWRCNKESKSDDEIDKEVYSKLVELDTRLGTTASKQLYCCLYYTLNLDIIKVWFQLRIKEILIVLVDKCGAS